MTPAEAQRALRLLRRNLDCQAGSLRQGFPPLPQLHRQAQLLDDQELERQLEAALRAAGRPLLCQRWSTFRTDPAELRVLRGHGGGVRAVAFSPGGDLLASASFDRTVRLWEVTGDSEPRVLRGHEDWVNAVAFSPGGDLLASASADGTVRLWEVTGQSEPRVLLDFGASVPGLAIHPSGRWIALGTGIGEVALLEVIVP